MKPTFVCGMIRTTKRSFTFNTHARNVTSTENENFKNTIICHVALLSRLVAFNTHHDMHAYIGGKGKAIPLQALTGPEGSRRLRLQDFKTIGT
jgi:hypothetical protein